jgi:hypothetical protein
MEWFEADIAGLRKAADASRSAGDQARRINLADGPAGIAQGMPGSVSATKSGPLAEAWRTRLTAWADDVGRFGDNLSSTADLYQANDEAAERDFSFWGSLFG